MHHSTVASVSASISHEFDATNGFLASSLESRVTVEAWTSDESDSTDYTPETGPTYWSEAYWLGFSLARAGEDPEPPREMALKCDLMAFYGGKLDGEMASQLEADAAYEAWLDRLDVIHAEFDSYADSEVIEAVGCIAARKGGAL